MGLLQTAGIVSGMGAGLQRGLETMQSGIIQQGLTDADRKFQSEKLQLQMDHAERLQRGTIAAHADEGDKTRAQAKSLAGESNQLHRDIAEQQITTEESKIRDASRMKQAELDMQEKRYSEHDKTLREIYGDKAGTKSNLKTLASLMNDLSDSAKAKAAPEFENYKSLLKLRESSGSEDPKLEALILKSYRKYLSYMPNLNTPPVATGTDWKGKFFGDIQPGGKPVGTGSVLAPSGGILNSEPPAAPSPGGRMVNIPDNQYSQPIKPFDPNAPRIPVEGYNRP